MERWTHGTWDEDVKWIDSSRSLFCFPRSYKIPYSTFFFGEGKGTNKISLT